jgi:hypothetical protein
MKFVMVPYPLAGHCGEMLPVMRELVLQGWTGFHDPPPATIRHPQAAFARVAAYPRKLHSYKSGTIN